MFLSIGRSREGLEASQTALNLRPDSGLGLWCAGMALRSLKRYGESITTFERAVQLSPTAVYLSSELGQSLAAAGFRDRAEEILCSLDDRAAAGAGVSPFWRGALLVALGQVDEGTRSSSGRISRARRRCRFSAPAGWTPCVVNLDSWTSPGVSGFLRRPYSTILRERRFDGAAVGSRPCTGSCRHDGHRRVARIGRSGPSHRAPRIYPLLVRRASRHGQHRQLGTGDPDRAHRFGHLASARGLGRHHAAEPYAAARGRSVSHAGGAAPGSHRSRSRPCTRHRSRHLARAAPVRWRAVSRSGARAAGPVTPHVSRRASVWIGLRGARRRGASANLGAGLSGAMAAFAGSLGLGYSFARHFSPTRRCRRFARIASTSCRPTNFPRPT